MTCHLNIEKVIEPSSLTKFRRLRLKDINQKHINMILLED